LITGLKGNEFVGVGRNLSYPIKVGDEIFFKILRTNLERYRYSNASTQDFIALSEEISGQELSPFFDAWLMGTNTPDFPQPSK
jgi:aminopeptidase N